MRKSPLGKSKRDFPTRVQNLVERWKDAFGFRYVPRVLKVSETMVVISDVLSFTDSHLKLLLFRAGASSLRIDFQCGTAEVSRNTTEPLPETFGEETDDYERVLRVMRSIKRDESAGDLKISKTDSGATFTGFTQLTPRALSSLLMLNVPFTIHIRTRSVHVLTEGNAAKNTEERGERAGEKAGEAGEAGEEACTTGEQ